MNAYTISNREDEKPGVKLELDLEATELVADALAIVNPEDPRNEALARQMSGWLKSFARTWPDEAES